MNALLFEKGDAQLHKNLKTNFYCAAIRYPAFGGSASVRISRICSVMLSFSVLIGLLSPVFAQSIGTATAETPHPAPSVDEQDKRNQLDSIKNGRGYIKDLRREVQGMLKDVKNLDVTKINTLFTKREECLTRVEPKVGTEDFWNASQECNDLQQEIEDELNDTLRPQRDCASHQQSLNDRKKEKKNQVDRNLKDILKSNKDADVSGLKEILADMEEAFQKADQLLLGACTEETRDALSDLSQDVNDYFQDWYDLSGEVSEKVNQAQQLEEGRKELDKNIKRQCEKEFSREVKDLEKKLEKAKKKGSVSDEAQKAYDQAKGMFDEICVNSIAAMEKALQANDGESFQDAKNSFWENQQDFWNVLNEAKSGVQEQQQSEDALKEIARLKKDNGNMRKEYDRLVKKNGGNDIPELQESLNQVEQFFEEAEKAAKEDPQSWWNDYSMNFNDLSQQFWDRFQGLQMMGDMKRQLKDLNHELKFHDKDLENWKKDPDVDTEVIGKLEGLVGDMKNILSQVEPSGNDPDTGRDLIDSFNEFRFEWNQLTRSLFGKQQFTFMVEQVKREVEHAQKVLGDLLKRGDITQEEWNVCNDFAVDVLKKIADGVFQAEDNPESMFMELEQKAQEVCPALDKVGAAPAPDQAYYEDYFHNNVGFERDIGNAAADILARVSQDIVERVFQKVISDPSMIQNLLKVAGEKYKDAAAGTLESVTSFYSDEATQRDLLEKKTQILELNQQLSDLQKQVQIAKDKLADLQKIQDEIAEYNFFGSAGDNIRNEIEDFIEAAKSEGISKDVIRAKIDELKKKKDEAIQESKQAKLDAGIIPFKDADDHEWFTKFAARVKEKGWIQGTGTSGGAEMNPSGITNVAEAIMMFARVEGIDEGATPISGVGKRLPDWAKAAAGTLDEAGVDLDEIFGGKNPGDSVSRGEVARLLVQVLKLPEVAASEADVFKDIKLANGAEKAAIAAVLKADIMTGQGGTGPKVFDVKGPLNRAALVKILDLASGIVAAG